MLYLEVESKTPQLNVNAKVGKIWLRIIQVLYKEKWDMHKTGKIQVAYVPTVTCVRLWNSHSRDTDI